MPVLPVAKSYADATLLAEIMVTELKKLLDEAGFKVITQEKLRLPEQKNECLKNYYYFCFSFQNSINNIKK
jgi:hypothetical protein